MSELLVTSIYNQEGTGAPNLPKGAVVTGVITATSFSGSGANLTGIDATALKDDGGSVKIQANSDGAVVTGILTVSSNVSIAGTLTYEDVTNIDSVGVITARGGSILVIGDTNPTFQVKTGSTSRLKIIGDTGNNKVVISSQEGYPLTLGASSGGGISEALRITSTGSVGIATAAPAGTLHVQGNQVGAIVAMAANSVNCSLGNYFTKTITGATTFTFDSVPSNVEYSFTLEVTLNGSNAITWPTSVKWNADTAPTITDGKTQMFMFLTSNGGTRWRGSALVDYVN